MPTREKKVEEVTELREAIDGSTAVVVVDYRGLSVSDANDLRSRLRDTGPGAVRYRVAKNTLLKRAFEGTDASLLDPWLSGPTAVAIGYEEPPALAKVLVNYAKENEKFEIKGAVIEGDVADLEAIRALAALPGKDELRGMLAGTVQAPMRNMAGTLQAVMGHLRNALEQRTEQLEGNS